MIRCTCILLALLASFAPPAAAEEGIPEPCTPLARHERRAFDLQAAPLSDVARAISCALDRNILFHAPTLAAKSVTFIAPKAVGRRELLAAWQAMLLENGLLEERRGGFFVIRAMR